MPTLQFVHGRLSVTVLLYLLILGLWGLWSYLRGRGISPSLWGALAIAELLIVVEGLLGAGLFVAGYRPARTGIHILYGVFLAVALPGAYTLTRERQARGQALIFALVVLFLAGVAIRARMTGGG